MDSQAVHDGGGGDDGGRRPCRRTHNARLLLFFLLPPQILSPPKGEGEVGLTATTTVGAAKISLSSVTSIKFRIWPMILSTTRPSSTSKGGLYSSLCLPPYI